MTVVSLLPSATEIVAALGMTDALAGVSHECDFPPAIVGRPVVTASKIDSAASSAVIDGSVRALVRDGLSVYRINTDVLRALDPDVIVTQEQCAVCAVSYEEVVAAARSWLRPSVSIVSLNPGRLADVFTDIQRVADALGCSSTGAALVARLQQRLEAIRERARNVRSRPRVACIEWLEPLMMAGNWMPELVELGGGTSVLAEIGARSRTVSWDELTDAAPDVVVLMPCGFTLPQTARELPALMRRVEWRRLPAARNGRVYAADGNAYLNRPGPRIVESAELLAGLIQPGFFAAKIPANSYARVSIPLSEAESDRA